MPCQYPRNWDALRACRASAPSRRTLESPQTARVTVDGRTFAFCSNDYLGLANHPELIATAQEAVARWGVGAGASHLVLGHMGPHQAAEERLAAFVGLRRARCCFPAATWPTSAS